MEIEPARGRGQDRCLQTPAGKIAVGVGGRRRLVQRPAFRAGQTFGPRDTARPASARANTNPHSKQNATAATMINPLAIPRRSKRLASQPTIGIGCSAWVARKCAARRSPTLRDQPTYDTRAPVPGLPTWWPGIADIVPATISVRTKVRIKTSAIYSRTARGKAGRKIVPDRDPHDRAGRGLDYREHSHQTEDRANNHVIGVEMCCGGKTCRPADPDQFRQNPGRNHACTILWLRGVMRCGRERRKKARVTAQTTRAR